MFSKVTSNFYYDFQKLLRKFYAQLFPICLCSLDLVWQTHFPVSVKLQSRKTTEEQKRLLEEKLKKMTEKFEYLVTITTTKTVKLKEANRQRLYYTAYEDFKFWLSSVEVQLQETNYGKDLATVSNQRKKHAYFEEGVRLHADQLKDLNTLADECIAAGQFDPEEVKFDPVRSSNLTLRRSLYLTPRRSSSLTLKR